MTTILIFYPIIAVLFLAWRHTANNVMKREGNDISLSKTRIIVGSGLAICTILVILNVLMWVHIFR